MDQYKPVLYGDTPLYIPQEPDLNELDLYISGQGKDLEEIKRKADMDLYQGFTGETSPIAMLSASGLDSEYAKPLEKDIMNMSLEDQQKSILQMLELQSNEKKKTDPNFYKY